MHSVTCHFKSSLSSGRTSTEKSTGLLVGINEIPPCVLISSVPMMIPEWLWTLSTSLFLWKGVGNILYFYALHKCNSFLFTVINKYKKSRKKGLSLLFYSRLSGGSSFWMGAQSHYVEYHWKSVLFLKEENAHHKSHTTSLWDRVM